MTGNNDIDKAPLPTVQTVKIIPPIGDGARNGMGTRIVMPDGSDLPGVTQVDVRFSGLDLITAQIEVCVETVEIEAHPLLGLETVRKAAKAYGFALVPETDVGGARGELDQSAVLMASGRVFHCSGERQRLDPSMVGREGSEYSSSHVAGDVSRSDPLTEMVSLFRKWDAVGLPAPRDLNVEYPQLKF